MGIEDCLNYCRINERITTSGSVVADTLATLGAAGYDVVINLLPDESSYAVGGEAAIVAGQGVGYVYIPVDFATPSHEDFEAFVSAMDASEGKTVHVHCAANYRVSAFFSLYAMRKGWWSAPEADAHIGTIWNPPEFPAWQDFIAAERARMVP